MAKKVQLGAGLQITVDQHEQLVKYITRRLDFAAGQRAELVSRFAIIDRDMNCFLELNEDDKVREKQNQQGKGLKPTDQKLALAAAQVADTVTYLMEVFFPNGEAFEALGGPEEQDIGKSVVRLLNENATRRGYYLQHARAFENIIKYNYGGFKIGWQVDYGNSVSDDGMGHAKVTYGVVWSGNAVQSLDMYNTYWDPSVKPFDLATKGEFVATVQPITAFSFQRLVDSGTVYNYDGLLDTATQYTNRYVAPPITRRPPAINVTNVSNAGGNSWINFLGAGMTTLPDVSIDYYELVEYIGWIIPEKFGLPLETDVTKAKMQVWRFILVNDKRICLAERLDNAHGMLPVTMAQPNSNDTGLQPQSIAEQLLPWQAFASYLLNVHQRAFRKALYGVTLYDGDVVDLDGNDFDEAKRLRVTVPSGKSLANSVMHFTEAPQTSGTLNEVQNIHALMQMIMPTDIQRQVASLERATQYQAAAVVQGSNRKSHMLARVINDQALAPLRTMEVTNMLQYQDAMTLRINGQEIVIDPKQIRDIGVERIIGDGLKAIDRLSVIEGLRSILDRLLQVPEAWAKMDLLAFMNYWTTLLGDRFNLQSFAYKSQIDALPVDVKNQLFAMYQQMQQQQQSQTQGVANAPAAGNSGSIAAR